MNQFNYQALPGRRIRQWHNRTRRSQQRRGGMIVLVATSLVVLLAFAALIVDIAWISVIQTEAQVASDLSTRGALNSFVNDHSEDPYDVRVERARAVGETIYESVTIGQSTLDIDPEEFKFGFDLEDGFVEDDRFANAVRLNLDKVKADGFRLFFAPIFGTDSYDAGASTTVSFTPIDVVLCLDISRSMAWAVGNNQGPGGVTIDIPPVPGSRWLALVDAVESFLEKADERSPSLRISLVTFGGGVRRRVDTPWDKTRTRVETDLEFIGAARNSIDTRMDFISSSVLGWTTPIREALSLTHDVFLDQSSSEGVRRVVILLSDGAATTGSPIGTASDLAAEGVIINTIYFSGSSQGRAPMQQIASIAGGLALDADSKIELDQAFNQILSQLSVRIVE